MDQSEAGSTGRVQVPGLLAPGVHEVRALRWFGRGRVLCESLSTGWTAPVALLLPGERASVVVGDDGMLRNAVVQTIHEPSSERVSARCSEFGRCPGCTMQHVSLPERVRYAQLLCSEVLARFGATTIDPQSVRVVMGDEGGHRIRTRLRLRPRAHAFDGAPAFEIGMAQWPDATLPLADFTQCLANAPDLRRAAEALRDAAPTFWDAHTKETPDADALHFELELSVHEGAAPASLYDERARKIMLVIADDASLQTCLIGVLRDFFCTRDDLEIEAGSDDRPWSHANPRMQERLYEEALALMDVTGKKVWDLTCGEGGFSLALARAGAEVWASDRHWDAVLRCQENVANYLKTENSLASVTVRGGDALAMLRGAARRDEAMDILVINPMREPLGRVVMEAVDGSSADALLYLAPAPKAGARDLGVLVEKGWTLSSCVAVDLHPWTGQLMMVFCAFRGAKK